MDENRAAGLWGEIFAARFLRDEGYEILSSNYRCRFGEVDLIIRDKNEIAFVEVKARTKKMIASPLEFVTYGKQKKITLAASLYYDKCNCKNMTMRFDVIEVYLNDDLSLEKINHLKNAFDSAL